ncbi:hypothetical protein [Stutzerimonas tarimensis]|uniref:Uncharacterized protein n=1 Tax=Stutzerimonas tarimensis TaxID=1507735 RepID=A0ABV7T823_9GAMM
MELLQQALLTLSAGASAVWVGRYWHHADGQTQPPLFCAMLALLLATGAGASASAQLMGVDSGDARDWLERATYQLGLPLAAVACLSLARGWRWSRSTWGRLVLGLCAFFELARLLDWSTPYALGLGLASALVVLFAGLQRPGATTLGPALVAAVLLLGTLPFAGSPLAAWQALLLAIASPLLAWLVSLPPAPPRDQPQVG